jgi:hypothetical protein
MSRENSDRIIPLLAVFCSLFSLLIATLHDSEFYNDDNNHAGTYIYFLWGTIKWSAPKLNCVALVHEETIPIERLPLVSEVSVNFCR